jgi:outer membrane protein
MKRYGKIIALCLPVLLYHGALSAKDINALKPQPKSYSLFEMYRIALERAERIKVSEEKVYLAELDREKALSVLLPGLTAFGDYTQYSQKETFEDFTIQPENTTAWGFRAGQTFTLNGKELIALKIANEIIEQRTFDSKSIQEAYLLLVAEAYFGVLKAQKLVEIAVANVNRLKTYKDAVLARLKVEAVTKTALFRSEAELSSARASLVRTENFFKLQQSILSRVVGLKSGYKLIEPDVKVSAIGEDQLDTLKQAAYSERSELKSLDMQKAIAENKVKFAKSDYWPKVSLEGMYISYDETPGGQFTPDDSLSLTLGLRFQMYDGGLRRARIKEALTEERMAGLAMADQKKQIAIEIEEAVLDMETQKGVYQAVKDELTFGKENYKAVSRQFDHGLSNSLDIMDANTVLVTSEVKLSEAYYNYQLAQVKLDRAKGTFLKKILKQLRSEKDKKNSE